MMNEHDWIPLFPLNTVLFPRGVLPLRVFETRYVDMVRERMKSGAPFGVVAIRAGNEVGTAAEPYDVGTLAHIVACDVEDLGVLLLHTQGGERFRILEKRTQRNQLIEARIAPLPADDPSHTGESLSLCARVLQVVIDELSRRTDEMPDGDFINPFTEPHALDSPTWVANRWSEMLPIALEDKQELLELTDAGVRLQRVERYLQDNGVL
ncbi:MAG: LON peptidase substrate-binding domain-containing protein [Oxalobacteraceae bacterium]|nr:LON peptidase substrate-binding domain-containing protein [Oxalobacteraceae bacterium]